MPSDTNSLKNGKQQCRHNKILLLDAKHHPKYARCQCGKMWLVEHNGNDIELIWRPRAL